MGTVNTLSVFLGPRLLICECFWGLGNKIFEMGVIELTLACVCTISVFSKTISVHSKTGSEFPLLESHFLPVEQSPFKM